MKKWNRFVLSVDPEAEASIIKSYHVKREVLKAVSSTLFYSYGEDWEKETEKVAFGSLARGCICLESILLLLREGYYGSVNALLRQVYESLSWAKLSIDNCNTAVLKEMHDSFYADLEKGKRVSELTHFLKCITFEDENSICNQKEIEYVGKKIFSDYSAILHASVYSQQIPFESDCFYHNMKECHAEVSMWILCLIEVLQSYWKRRLIGSHINDEDNLLRYGCFAYLCDVYTKVRYKLLQSTPSLEDSLIVYYFRDLKWKIK